MDIDNTVIRTFANDAATQEIVDHVIRLTLEKNPGKLETLMPRGLGRFMDHMNVIIPTAASFVPDARAGWAKTEGNTVHRVGLTQMGDIYLASFSPGTVESWQKVFDQLRKEKHAAEVQVSGLRSKLDYLTKQNTAMKKALEATGMILLGDKMTVKAGDRKIKI